MADDKVQARTGLEATLKEAFSRVGAKMVSVNDLIKQFELAIKEEGPNKLSFLESMFAKRMLKNLQKHELAATDGVVVRDGSAYVSTQFLEQTMIKEIDAGKADGYLGSVRKAGLDVVTAVQKCPDSTQRCGAPTPKMG